MEDDKLKEMVRLANSVFKSNPDWDRANRQEVNLKILQIIELGAKAWPSLRFGQLLSCFNLDINTFGFNTESVSTLDRMKETESYKELQKSFE